MNPSSAASEPGEIAGRYQVIRKLGAGAFGTVYKVKDKTLGRMLAIKVIRFDSLVTQGSDADALKERFMREARVSAQLKHPNIVTIYDVGDEGGTSYLAMELIDGVGLDTLIAREGRLPLARAVAIGAQVADALSFAHKSNIVHRDVKPPNIMIEAGDRVKVTDFGIAKVTNTTQQLTVAGSIVGTPSYMSPEQTRGESLDGRSDLFAVGCVLYEMLSGRKAFESESLTGLLFKILTEEPRSIKELEPSLPDALVRILSKALAKVPGARYQSGQELASDLLALTHAPPREARSPAPPFANTVPPLAPTAVAPPRQVLGARAPFPAVPTARIERPRSSAALWIGLAVLGLLGLGAMAGIGWYVLRSSPETASPSALPPTLAAGPSSVPSPVAGPEATPSPEASRPASPEALRPVTPAPSRRASLEPSTLVAARPTEAPKPQEAIAPVTVTTLPEPAPRPTPETRRPQTAPRAVPPTPSPATGDGRRVAQAYRHETGAAFQRHEGKPREREPRDVAPGERPAITSLRSVMDAENGFLKEKGRYGTLAELVGVRLLTLNVPVSRNTFAAHGYRFELELTKDGFSVNAIPLSGSHRPFRGDDTGYIYEP